MRHETHLRIGKLLMSAGVLDRQAVNRILQHQEKAKPRKKFLELGIQFGYINRAQSHFYLELQYLISSLMPRVSKCKELAQDQVERFVQSIGNQEVYRDLGGTCYCDLEQLDEFWRGEEQIRAIEREIYVVPRKLLEELEQKFFKKTVLAPLSHPTLPMTLLFRKNLELLALEDAEAIFHMPMHFQRATQKEAEKVLGAVYSTQRPRMAVTLTKGVFDYATINGVDLSKEREDEDVVSILNHLLVEGGDIAASDLHVEPLQQKIRVRYRKDGILGYYTDLPADLAGRLVSRAKVVCGLDISERRRPQDGKIRTSMKGTQIDMRVSTYPGETGESVVMRFLPKASDNHLFDLGMSPAMLEKFIQIIESPSGIVLVTGPTGSGKSTTLYGAARHLNTFTRKILTIEDPVEYSMQGVIQGSVNENIGVDYLMCLKGILRQDPDVILLGEIRDEETARTGMQAALTGHVVLSTLHAKDTISAVFRLLDLKIEPYLVANALDLVLAQRLVRMLCEQCKREVPVAPGQATRIGKYLGGKTKTNVAVGCAACLKTGYRGRRAIFEMLDFRNDELRDVVLGEPSVQAMRKIAAQGLFITLQQAGWKLAAEGVASLDEVEHIAG